MNVALIHPSLSPFCEVLFNVIAVSRQSVNFVNEVNLFHDVASCVPKIRIQSEMYLLESMNFFLIPPNVVCLGNIESNKKGHKSDKMCGSFLWVLKEIDWKQSYEGK